MAHHKRRRPIKQRASARCMCNPHQVLLGNSRAIGFVSRAQRREDLTRREEMR